MSGPITDMPIRTCRQCRAVWIEDDRMYEDPEVCPHCGTVNVPPDKDTEEVDTDGQ